jgi:hypothetical protein
MHGWKNQLSPTKAGGSSQNPQIAKSPVSTQTVHIDTLTASTHDDRSARSHAKAYKCFMSTLNPPSYTLKIASHKSVNRNPKSISPSKPTLFPPDSSNLNETSTGEAIKYRANNTIDTNTTSKLKAQDTKIQYTITSQLQFTHLLKSKKYIAHCT